jgi:hypothetical protein
MWMKGKSPTLGKIKPAPNEEAATSAEMSDDFYLKMSLKSIRFLGVSMLRIIQPNLQDRYYPPLCHSLYYF